MNSYQLIGQLIKLVEEFEKGQQPQTAINLANFAGFLNTTLNGQQQHQADVRFGNQEPGALDGAYQLDNNIARLFTYMGRYAKAYIKKALQHTPLASGEEFTCLAVLLTHQNLSKTALIQLNMLEKTSGTEIINRLLQHKLVHQWDDDIDKRIKRIAITDEGKNLLYKVFSDMNHVGKMVTGNLSELEKFTLQYLLQKLENFHYQIHVTKQITSKLDLIKHTSDGI